MITFPQLEAFLFDLKSFISHSLKLEDLSVCLKEDKSPVTHFDTAISEFCKTHPSCAANFYSEEDHSLLCFPSIILDPIDGTKELVKLNGECVVSIAWMSSSTEGQALIFNPFTGFKISTFDSISWTPQSVAAPYLGLVSRSEIGEMSDLKNFSHQLVARGSIAFKLGLLASGGCDFVVSLKPKSIWDIAAGTIMAWQRGMMFFSNGELVTELNQKHYAPPLVWGKAKVAPEVNRYFSSP